MKIKYRLDQAAIEDLIKFYLEAIYEFKISKGLTPTQFKTWKRYKEILDDLFVQLKLRKIDINDLTNEFNSKIELKYKHQHIKVKVDGAARGNDNVDIENSSGIAFIIYDENDNVLEEYSECLGSCITVTDINNSETSTVNATNNVAEYSALIRALEYLVDNYGKTKKVTIMSDSDIVVNQVNYRIATRADHLVNLRNYAIALSKNFDDFKLLHIPREENKEADALVNKALDQKNNFLDV